MNKKNKQLKGSRDVDGGTVFYEIPDGNHFRMDKEGSSGTRIFLESAADAIGAGMSTCSLPKIGESFVDVFHGASAASSTGTDNVFALCKCRTVERDVFYSDPRKYRWTCTYENDYCDPNSLAVDNQASSKTLTTAAALPHSLEAGGEFEPVTVKGLGWTWHSAPGTDPVEQALLHRVPTYQLTIEKVVPEEDFKTWMATLAACVGRLNTKEFYFSDDALNWLCLGATTKPYRDGNGNLKHLCELRFTGRFIPNAKAVLGQSGWNVILRDEKATYDMPEKTVGGNTLHIYLDVSFDQLLNPSQPSG